MNLHGSLHRSLVVMGCAVAAACAERDDAPDIARVTRDSAGIAIVEYDGFGDSIPVAFVAADSPEVVIGVADGEPAYVFGSVTNATRLSDGRLVVLDGTAQELRFFDAAGRHLVTQGREGGGPGEYRRAAIVGRSAGDTLFIADQSAGRLTVIGPDGTLIRTISLTELGAAQRVRSIIGRFADGDFLGSTTLSYGGRREASGIRSDSITLFRVAADGSRADSIARLFGSQVYIQVTGTGPTRSTMVGSPAFGRHGTNAVAGDGFVHTTGEAYEIRRYDRSGRLTDIIRVRRDLRPVTEEHIAWYRAANLDRAESEWRPRIEQYIRGMPYPSRHPAFTDFMIDGAGRVWALEGGILRERGRWWVFADGALLGEARLGERCSPLEVGEGYVLCRPTGDEEIPRLELYRLTARERG
jgi:hypothetical protein